MLQILTTYEVLLFAQVLSPLILSFILVLLNIPQKVSNAINFKSAELFLVFFHIAFVFITLAIESKYGNFGKLTAFYSYSGVVDIENIVYRSNISGLIIYYVLISTALSGVICALANNKVVKWFFIGCVVGLPSILYTYKERSNGKIT